jgi:[ribosomal protein S5]-alanine N-acetyltransferase
MDNGPALELVPLHDADPADVLAFETANRAWFRTSIPDRGDAYYRLDHVRSTLEQAVLEWREGQAYLFVVVEDGTIIARANLSVRQRSADVGYRVAEHAGGRGVATRAVGLLVAEASARGLAALTATTSAEGLASQAVLRANGFREVARVPGELSLHGRTIDAVRFRRP